MSDYMLDHILDQIIDNMLDHLIIGLITMAWQYVRYQLLKIMNIL